MVMPISPGAMFISSRGNLIVCQVVFEAWVYIRNLCAHCTAHSAGFGGDIPPLELIVPLSLMQLANVQALNRLFTVCVLCLYALYRLLMGLHYVPMSASLFEYVRTLLLYL